MLVQEVRKQSLPTIEAKAVPIELVLMVLLHVSGRQDVVLPQDM